MDSAGSPILLNCLMYKMCYYRFGEMQVNRSNVLVWNSHIIGVRFFHNAYFVDEESIMNWVSYERYYKDKEDA